MSRIDGDRRQFPRVQVQQPCKVFDPQTGKYLAGTTRDLSTHGLLLDLARPTGLKPGDLIHVGVAMKRRQGFIQAKEMIASTVVRVMQTIDDHAMVAVKFADSSVASAAAIQRAAA